MKLIDFTAYLVAVATYVVIVPILVGLYLSAYQPKALKILLYGLIAVLLCDLLMFVFEPGAKNTFLYIFSAIDVLMMTGMYAFALGDGRAGRFILITGVLFLPLIGLDSFFWSGLRANGYSNALEKVYVCGVVLYYLTQLFQDEGVKKLRKHPMLWVSIGILAYNLVGLFDGLSEPILNYSQNLYLQFYQIWCIAAIFMNGCFGFAFWLGKRKRKSLKTAVINAMKIQVISVILSLLFLLVCSANALQGVPSASIAWVKIGPATKDAVVIDANPIPKAPLIFSYDQNDLLFQFINNQDSTQHAFVYKLIGLDYEWMSCQECSQAQYAHLDGGEYTFSVKTTAPNAIPQELNFTIKGNILHQWWFVPMLFLYFLAIFGVGIYFFMLYQFRQKLQRQRLIHQEKMVAMAELTSGIAHEIQNPLNFVNNFSDLNLELARELQEQFEKISIAEKDKQYLDEILADLIHNQQKINNHGQQASGIVKGMLEHSRVPAVETELTDLNQLLTECLQLSYHGMKLRDKDFNASYQLVTTENLPHLSIIPKEMGRVFLNLMNNAFYSVNKQAKQVRTAYQPKVTVVTEQIGNKVVIKIKDNGAGIPEDLRSKIFQPFFTTKPVGQGTGLGLSLAYDIVTKGHNGSLELESSAYEETTFVVSLPSK